MNAIRIAAAGMLAYGAWVLYQRSQEQDTGDTALSDWFDLGTSDIASSADGILTDAGQTAAEFVDNITGGFMQISAMSRVNPMDLYNPNVQAVLRVIRAGEGTSGDNGYRTLFGGALFSSFADHPRQKITKGSYTSTAAGAYQFLSSTWDETKRIMALPDFSPRSQDIAALGRIAARGALEDVKAGRFDTAIKKISREWASLPGSPYGQPMMSWDRARSLYASNGGEMMTA